MMISDGPKQRTTKPVKKIVTKKPSSKKKVKPLSPKGGKAQKAPAPAKTAVRVRNAKDTGPATRVMSFGKAVKPNAFKKNPASTKGRSDLKKVVKKSPTTKPATAAKKPLKVFLPAETDIGLSLGIPRGEISEELPAEYGESELLVLPVDPDVVYFNWEVKEEDVTGEKDIISMRVFDVTGIDFDGTNAHEFQEISLGFRVGSGFYNLGLRGRDIIAEVGFLSAGGKFIEVLRSEKIAIPEQMTPDELGIGQKLLESWKPVGY